MENLEIAGKTVVVTGGAGFIGSHLVKALVEKKAKVIVVDINIDSHSFFAKEKLNKKVLYKQVDITDKKKVFTVFKACAPDYIFHLAAEPIVTTAYTNPIRTFETNIMGTIYILEAARTLPSVKCIIIASSDKAYGKTKKAYTEEVPLQGDHPYDVSKSCTDLIAQTYYKTYGLPVVITRFGNVYGEGDMHFDRIIPGICRTIAQEEILEIRSDGSYIRDYIYTKDVADAYIFLLIKQKETIGQAFNVSSNNTYSVIDLIQQAEIILKKKIPYVILNKARNEIPYQHLDDNKIRKLGWKNKYTLENSLKNTLLWYQKNLL